MKEPETRRVRVLRKFLVGTESQEIGKIITLPARTASEVVGWNKAEYVSDSEVETKPKKGG